MEALEDVWFPVVKFYTHSQTRSLRPGFVKKKKKKKKNPKTDQEFALKFKVYVIKLPVERE